jgi:hypothetical protein
MSNEEIKFEDFPKSKESSPKTSFLEGHWFKVAERLYEESGQIPDPLQIKAGVIIRALGLPSGEVSALEINKEGKRINPEKDRIIAEYLTNKSGVVVEGEGEFLKKSSILSADFRDIYPAGLPEKLEHALDPDTRAIMEIEYEHARYANKKTENIMTRRFTDLDYSVNYFRLPGGVDLFIRGYEHHKNWQEKHKDFLQRINKHAQVICIEGNASRPLGNSLDVRWSARRWQQGHYDALMHEAVTGGFKGFFTEVDARDQSKIMMDHTVKHVFPNLPDSFFKKYFEFLKKEHPHLAEKIGSVKDLKHSLKKQSTTGEGPPGKVKIIRRQGKNYSPYVYFTQTGEVSLEPTFLEMGQYMFTDALAAIKLHLIAKLMAGGHLPKGPIVDYEGAMHLSTKSFFLRYPGYAAEVVLRTINELMAGRAEEKRWLLRFFKKGNIQEIYKIFENPDWPEVVKEIVRLPFKKAEDDPTNSKPVNPGPNQRKLIDYPVNFLEIYNINPESVIPTDEEIQKIRADFVSKLNS